MGVRGLVRDGIRDSPSAYASALGIPTEALYEALRAASGDIKKVYDFTDDWTEEERRLAA